MKKVLAMLLAGCLALQPVSNFALTAFGSDLFEDMGEVSTAAEDSISLDDLISDPAEGQSDTLTDTAAPEVPESPPGDVYTEGTEDIVPSAPEADSSVSEEEPLADEETADDFIIIEDPSVEDPSMDEQTEIPEEAPLENESDASTETPSEDAEIPAVPEEEDAEETDEALLEDAVIPEEIETETEEKPSIMQINLSAEANNAKIQVEVGAGLPFDSESDQEREVTVALSGGAVTVDPVKVSLNKDHMSELVEFPVAPGSYTVYVSSEKFGTYTQVIQDVKEFHVYRVRVYTDKVLTGSDNVQYGVLQLGDANGDGQITSADRDAVLSAIYAGTYDEVMDLNSDRKVDLADLQYVVNGLNAAAQISTIERTLLPRNVETNSKVAKGDVKDLLKEEGGDVQLKPEKAGNISPENPVELSFGLVPDDVAVPYEDIPKLEGLSIQAPHNTETANPIKSGKILVDVQGPNGEEETITVDIGEAAAKKEIQIDELEELFEDSDSLIKEETPIEEEEEEAPVYEESETEAEQVQEEALPEDLLIMDAPEEEPAAEEDLNAETNAEENAEAVPEEVPSEEAEDAEEGSAAPINALDDIILAAFEGLVPTCTVHEDGSIELDFGEQVAVKRVTIQITGTKKESDLVDIAKVEFVNDMDSRVPEPEMNIPSFNTENTIIDNEEFTVYWTPQSNVTGYVLYVSGVTKDGGLQTQEVHVSGTSYRVAAINDYPLKNYNEYTLKIRSVNGKWKSDYSAEIKVTPKPQAAPDPVDNVVLTGGYRSIQASWKDMKDANGYMVYYRKASDTTGEYKAAVADFTEQKDGANRLKTNSYTITGLDDNTEYSVYVLSWNDYDHGSWGKYENAKKYNATTKSADRPILPMYMAINGVDPYDEEAVGKVPDVIENAVIGNHGDTKMVQSKLDEQAEGNPMVNGQHFSNTRWGLGVVDNDYESYWTKTDWDDGVSYPVDNFHKGITITLDKEYEMNYLTFTAADVQYGFGSALVGYWSEEDLNNAKGHLVETEENRVGAMVVSKKDKNENPYFIVRFDKPVKAKMIHLYVSRSGKAEMKIAEIRFHKYDPLEKEIYDLYKDDMHTALAENVTETMIDSIEQRLDAGDKTTGEQHPLYEMLKMEIQNARDLLADKLTAKTVAVNPNITSAKDGHLGFGGLNAWQPLGKVVEEGEPLIVYVGHNSKPAGQQASVRLVYTQYHSESNRLSAVSGWLKVGKNVVTVPKLTDQDMEHGGQLYVEYGTNNPKDQYAIRVQGGKDIPVLNLYRLNEDEKKAAIHTYVEELKTYVNTISTEHKNHANEKNASRTYDEKNCVLNSTDIMMEHMMYSLPATEVLKSFNNSEDQLRKSLDLMEQLMGLFYQHKGLSNAAGAGSNNALPSQHLNIRYMQMFSGAFMYAAGNHIGIEWGQTGVAGAATRLDSFGWGIAHEIGHDINQSKYAIAEITNNYFAQLMMKAADETAETRIKYPKIYKKVTSGAIGRSTDLATQLGLYWQLHLAFDNHKDNWTSNDYQTQLANLFFARVDTYARTPSAAPKDEKKKIELKLGSDADQNLMRLSCAAAKADILEFFRRWGMVPDAETLAYAGLFDKSEKAIWYVSDSARDYRINHDEASGNVKGKKMQTSHLSESGNQVTITIPAQQPGDAILGYEILRSMRTDGIESTPEVIGFAEADSTGAATYIDTIASIDNRVLNYYVKAVDKFLNYSEQSFIGSEKVSTGGVLGKEHWTVKAENMTSAEDVPTKHTDDDPDAGMDGARGTVSTLARVIDGDTHTAYNAAITEGTGSITIDMGKAEEVTNLKLVSGAIPNLTIEVSTSGSDWKTVKQNNKDCANGGTHTIWFDSVKEDNRTTWIGTYDARFVKLTFSGAANVSISEIDICGPTGDDVEFIDDGIGRLKEAYKYGDKDEDVIPAGSLIFTGVYKGNPAFNMVLLFDEEGNVIGQRDNGKVEAVQVILAPVPENGHLGNTSSGAWVYYIDNPDTFKFNTIAHKKIRAELYRVDDAFTLENERIVSDTEFIDVPYYSLDQVPYITLNAKTTPNE